MAFQKLGAPHPLNDGTVYFNIEVKRYFINNDFFNIIFYFILRITYELRLNFFISIQLMYMT